MSIANAESTTGLDMRKFIALSMVAIFSFGAIADTPIATTIDGVEWRFRIDPETKTAMLGQCTTPNPSDIKEEYFACPSNINMNASSIPWIFDYEGTQYTVTRVGSRAFYNHRQLTGTLAIPDAVKEVLGFAFYLCTGLTELHGGDSVTNWQNSVFQGCSYLHGELPDLSAVTVFGERPFDSVNLTGDLKLGGSLTEIKGWALRGGKWDEAVVPANVTTVGDDRAAYGVFAECPNIAAIWVKGKPTEASKKYTTVYCGSLAKNCASLKMVLMGQNTKASGKKPWDANYYMLAGDEGVQALVPANGYWDGLEVGGKNGGEANKVWYYGPTNELDLVIDDAKMEATFTPTTENALTNVIAWAPLLKEHFNLDTVISITNRIDSSLELTDAMLQNVTISARLWYLTFSVQSQAQLDNVLAAVSVDTPVLIDIEGAGRNQITVPEGRQVAILAKGGWTFGEKPKGIVITFR